ncbi:MAG: hypothetical protein ACMXYL_04050 [Candidatus Woesearchaeota archaeon]
MNKSLYMIICAFTGILLLSGAVHAGYLTGSRSVGPDGTTFTLSWFQGCGPGTRVEYLSGTVYRSSMNLNLGPNSCNVGGTLGNNRAVHCLIGSDVGRTSALDAVVNCDECPCEPVPGTNYNCNNVSGRCIACDACPCDEDWEDCEHLTCTTRNCTCNDDKCEAKSTDCVGGSMQLCECNDDKTDCICITQSCGGGGSSGDPNTCSASASWTLDSNDNRITTCRLSASRNIDDYLGSGAYSNGWRIYQRNFNPSSGWNYFDGWVTLHSGMCSVSVLYHNPTLGIGVNEICYAEATTGTPPGGSDPGDPDPGDPDPGDPDPNPCSVFCPPPNDDLCAEGIVCPI